MIEFRKRIIALAVAIIMSVSIMAVDVNAAVDTEADVHGFNVDSGVYKKSVWYNTVTTNVKTDGHIIGVCTTKIGMTRTKNKVSNSKYIDQFFVKCTMKGRNPKSGKAGYSEDLTISSTLPSSASLIAYSPESQAGMKSYQIGVNAGYESGGKFSAGISGSTNVTKKALEINNYSDTAARLVKINYDYENNWWIPSGYNTYGKYSYDESTQRMHFAAQTSKSNYAMSLLVQPKFEEMSGVGYWSFAYSKYSIVYQTITFTTPY